MAKKFRSYALEVLHETVAGLYRIDREELNLTFFRVFACNPALPCLGIFRQAESQDTPRVPGGLQRLIVPFHVNASGVADHDL